MLSDGGFRLGSPMAMFSRPKPGTRIHFVGISDIGMSGIAEILLNLGHRVSGSDLEESGRRGGCRPGRRHPLRPPPSTLRSPAIRPMWSRHLPARCVPTTRSGRRPGHHGIPVILRAGCWRADASQVRHRHRWLARQDDDDPPYRHGTAPRGLDPTAVIGGKLPQLAAATRGSGSPIIWLPKPTSPTVRSCAGPAIAVVTNIDPEHLDHYGDFSRPCAAFLDFINKVPFYGRAVLCLDHPEVRAPAAATQALCHLRPVAPRPTTAPRSCRSPAPPAACCGAPRRAPWPKIELPIPGVHNVSNALATLAVGDFLGIPIATPKKHWRRSKGRPAFHHQARQRPPAERSRPSRNHRHRRLWPPPGRDRATLAGARAGFSRSAPGRRVPAASLHPHARSLPDFARAFDDAQCVSNRCPAAGEAYSRRPRRGPGGIACETRGHPRVGYIARRSEVAVALLPELRPGDP